MSNMYAIKASTLTALGDAVRSKTGVESEKFEGIELYANNNIVYITANSISMSYKFIVDVTVLAANSNSPKAFYLFDSGNNYLYGRDIKLNDNFTTTVILDTPTLTLNFAISSSDPDRIKVNITIIPLDENGNEYKYTPLEMAEKVNELNIIPESVTATPITGNCTYKFANGGWDWFVNIVGNKIKTKDITDASNMFNYSNLENIPFDINIASNCSTLSNVFNNCQNLKTVPYIIGPEKALPTSGYIGCLNLGYLFNYCYMLREIPDDYFWKMVPNKEFWDKHREISSQPVGTLFVNCRSLRKLPDISMLGTAASYSSNLYNTMCNSCYVLDEIVNLPVLTSVTFTSNGFSSVASRCYRLKRFTFETNEDNTPKVAKWKSQTIDLSYTVGYGSKSNVLNYNSGITADKEVKDDATYQTLKNDPDWFTTDMAYSRYNHDSAVETINSLPDTSAYLATAGGTNTIKLKGLAGSATDGGAINTLTEEEIAVAAAKGWTVTFAN